MKNFWEIPVPFKETERIAITYGDPADALIAKSNYALYALPDAITNWQSIVSLLSPDHWYDVTAFYSRRKADLTKEADRMLYEYNQNAFDAAKEKSGLVLYYQGVLLSNANQQTDQNLKLRFVPNCLSFCIWKTLQLAKAGAKIPEHKRATEMISMWYEGFAIEKYQVILKKTSDKKILWFQRVPYKK